MELKSFKIFSSLILFYLHGAITLSYASPLLMSTNDASENVVSDGGMSKHHPAPTVMLKGSEGQGQWSGSEAKLQPKPLHSVNDLLLLLLASSEISNTNASASSSNSSFSDFISNGTANRNISSVMELLSAWLASRPNVTPTRGNNNVREQPFLTFIHNSTATEDAVDKNDQRQVLDWLHNIVFGSSQQSLLASQSQLYPDRDDYDDHGSHDHGDDYHGHDEDSSYYSDSGHGHSHSHDHGHDEFDYEYDHDHHTKGASSSEPGMHPYQLKGIHEVQFKKIVD